MKQLPLIMLAFAMLAAQAQVDPFAPPPGAENADPFAPDGVKPTPPKEFSVSKVNASKANKELFKQLWDAIQRPRFNGKSRRIEFWITQPAGKVGELHRYLTSSEAVLLRDPGLHEGSTVTVWANPDGVYDFNTVGAGVRRVPQFKEAVAELDENAPDQEGFVADLKAGKQFTVWLLQEKSCAKCLGDGKLGSLGGGGWCPDCSGTGEVLQPWVLKW